MKYQFICSIREQIIRHTSFWVPTRLSEKAYFKYEKNNYSINSKTINIIKTSDFKGLESNVIIYVHKYNSDKNFSYVGLTRARFYLYDIQLKE